MRRPFCSLAFDADRAWIVLSSRGLFNSLVIVTPPSDVFYPSSSSEARLILRLRRAYHAFDVPTTPSTHLPRHPQYPYHPAFKRTYSSRTQDPDHPDQMTLQSSPGEFRFSYSLSFLSSISLPPISRVPVVYPLPFADIPCLPPALANYPPSYSEREPAAVRVRDRARVEYLLD